MSRDLDRLIAYRAERPREALQDARVLADSERWNACMNRLYYACFYAVSALLLRHGLSSSKHSGVRALFNRHLVKDGPVAKELAQVFNDLFERRQQADYVDYVQFDARRVVPWILEVDEFLRQLISMANGSRN